MAKRKRSLSKETKVEKARPSFQALFQTKHSESSTSDAFQDVISFMEYTKKKDEATNSKILDLVQKLLDVLWEENAEPESKKTRGLIQKLDVANLLLPWAIKSILHATESSAQRELQWKTLHLCLDYLVREGADTSKALSMSAMHKIIPLATTTSFDSDKTNLGALASKAYCIMANRLYHPSFDHVCDSLLLTMASRISQGSANSNPILWDMTVATLRLLQTTWKKANPKKSFQLVIRTPTLLALSDIYTTASRSDSEWSEDPRPLVHSLIANGLFSPQHHIDGFRSLQLDIPRLSGDEPQKTSESMDVDGEAPKPSFHCYQEGLFSTIERELCPSEPIVSATILSLSQLLPLLFRAFLQQTNQLQNDIKEKRGKKKSANKIGQMQFQFFANLNAPLVKLLKSVGQPNDTSQNTAVLLGSLGQSLSILLDQDVYLPANMDEGNKNFDFLQQLSDFLLARVASADRNDNQLVSERQEILSLFKTISRLNHLLVHDKLGVLIEGCLTLHHEKASELFDKEAALMETLISTYKKLRQLDYFCRALIGATESLRDKAGVDGLQTLLLIVQSNRIGANLADAIQSSPIHQLKHVFSELNKWISEATKLPKGSVDKKSSRAAVSVLVEVCTLLLKGVRVDFASATELYPICNDFASGAVQALVDYKCDSTSDDVLYTKQGLLLCAHAIDLKNRCDFWIRNSKSDEATAEFHIPERVLQLLSEAIENVLANSDGAVSKELVEALQNLACHRIQQLDFEIHEKQRISFSTDSEEFSFHAELTEAKRLASFALAALSNDNDSDSLCPDVESRWMVLAKSIASWAPYAELGDVNSFLSCFFTSLSLSPQQQQYGQHHPPNTSSEGSTTAMWLLRDAAFLEIPVVVNNFGSSGLSFVATLLRKALSCCVGEKQGHLGRYACPVQDQNWKRLDTSSLHKIIDGDVKVKLRWVDGRDADSVEHYIYRCMTCLRTLNQVPGTIWRDSNDAGDAFESVIRMGCVCQALVVKSDASSPQMVGLLANLRRIAARMLTECGAKLAKKESLRRLFVALFKSTCVLASTKTLSTDSISDLIMSTRPLMSAIVDVLYEDEAGMGELVQGIEDAMSSHSGKLEEHECLVLTTFCRCIVATMSRSRAATEPVWLSTIDSIAGLLRKYVWPTACSYAFSRTKGTGDLTKLSSLLFLADVVRASSRNEHWLDQATKLSLEAKVVEKTREVLSNDQPSPELQSTGLLVAALAGAGPSHEARRDLIHEIVKPEVSSTNLFESAVCELLKDVETDELRDYLERLTPSSDCSEDTYRRLRIFRLVVLNLNSPEQVSVISKAAERVLYSSLNALVVDKESSESTPGAEYAVNLVIDMAGNRELLSVREREVAHILGQVASAMIAEPEHDGSFRPVSQERFNLCFQLVSFLLQRFSKQLHNCIPSMVQVLTVFLQNSLYGTLEELDIIDRGQKLGRLFELLIPHGDIYKKHVFCLLVEFVDALKRDLDPIRKNNLSPAMYCLLDILQQHETTQLNSMLDDMGRALLRTIHESYQKVHVYKGQ